MPKKRSHHTEPVVRRFYGERLALELIERLNQPNHDAQLATVHEALAVCQKMYSLKSRLHMELSKIKEGTPPVVEEVTSLQSKLREILKPFVSRPEVSFSGSRPSDSDFNLFWNLDESSPFYGLRVRGQHQPHFLFLRCVEAEIVQRIVQCGCSKFFYQRFSHQKFCSVSCRVQANQNTEAAREYRRSKQREYYRLHNTKNTK